MNAKWQPLLNIYSEISVSNAYFFSSFILSLSLYGRCQDKSHNILQNIKLQNSPYEMKNRKEIYTNYIYPN